MLYAVLPSDGYLKDHASEKLEFPESAQGNIDTWTGQLWRVMIITMRPEQSSRELAGNIFKRIFFETIFIRW